MKQVETRVLDDATQHPGFNRGEHFLRVIARDLDISVTDMVVADLGTGYGSIAIASARAAAARVYAVDANAQRVEEVAARANQYDLPIKATQANLLEPLSQVISHPVDLALLIGVVEYAGLWHDGAPPEELQLLVFKHALEILRPGGTLLVATKNRLWPSFTLRDLHTGQPLVNALPRGAADKLSLKTRGIPYREHIHTPMGWSKLMRNAGFSMVDCFFPYMSYQYPWRIVDRPALRDLGDLRDRSGDGDIALLPVSKKLWNLKLIGMGIGSALHIPVSHGLVFRCRRT